MKTILLLIAAAWALSTGAYAQQKLSFTVQNNKFNVSQNVDVGDVPNHFVRQFDLHGTIPANVMVNGLELSDIYHRGIAENLPNGTATNTVGFMVFVAKNGDKFYSRNGIAAALSAPNKATVVWTGSITGGTGQFAGIQGITREINTFDPSPGGTGGAPEVEIEYTIPVVAQRGTAEEAKAMLTKVIAAVKADRDVAIGMFQKGEGGFRDRDLYPYCFRLSDGKGVATPVAVPAGTDLRTLKDSAGTNIGIDTYTNAKQRPEGEIFEGIPYRFPKPGTTAPEFPKISYNAKVADLVCGVGYYK